MREVISLHVGQAGVQIGNACCECIVSKRVAQKKKRASGALIYAYFLCVKGELYTAEHGLSVTSFLFILIRLLITSL